MFTILLLLSPDVQEDYTVPAIQAIVCGMPDEQWRDSDIKFRHTVYQLAKEWELIDPYGDWNHCMIPLSWIHNRYLLLQDAPKIADVGILPDEHDIRFNLLMNFKYYEYAYNCFSTQLDQQQKWQMAMQENKLLETFWDNALTARKESSDIFNRRKALREIRKMLGEDDYNRGIMLPSVPLWLFVEN